MKVSLIVAMSQNNVIGKNNQMPWYLPADLQHFKAITLGKPIIMGRKTFESIGKPLPGRRNIIISRDKNLCIAGCDVFHSVDDALAAVQTAPEVMIIGGATLYAQLLPRAERIYLTRIEAVFDGDTFFPVLSAQWQLLSAETHRPDEKNKYHYCFEVWTNHSFFV